MYVILCINATFITLILLLCTIWPEEFITSPQTFPLEQAGVMNVKLELYWN